MDKEHKDLIQKAITLYEEGRYSESAEIYLTFEKFPQYRAPCRYMLAKISNVMGDPETAYELYYAAFDESNSVVSAFIDNDSDHPSRGYVFTGRKQEKEFINCPLCGKAGKPHWCYALVEAYSFTEEFNPVRMWLKCEDCNHLFARSFPENLSDSYDMAINVSLFPYYADLIGELKKHCKGNQLLEIGIGGCECSLIARKMGFDVFGIDVNEKLVEHARSFHGLDAEVHDFNEFESSKKWDIIIMGDVIEHVPDPVAAVKKASGLLSSDGVLWISTPDFESEFTKKAEHNDPMRKEAWHLNYFSKDSLYMLLRRFGLEPVANKASGHYNGSMEVIAVKGCI
jgi:2-polyprenyl-3-methyl-5-hydroxy-6-metoxy-1,4-benzoquinol methylase